MSTSIAAVDTASTIVSQFRSPVFALEFSPELLREIETIDRDAGKIYADDNIRPSVIYFLTDPLPDVSDDEHIELVNEGEEETWSPSRPADMPDDRPGQIELLIRNLKAWKYQMEQSDLFVRWLETEEGQEFIEKVMMPDTIGMTDEPSTDDISPELSPGQQADIAAADYGPDSHFHEASTDTAADTADTTAKDGSILPVITIDQSEVGSLATCIDKAEQAVLDLKRPIYQQGGRIVTIVKQAIKMPGGGKVTVRRIKDINAKGTRELFDIAAKWKKYNSKGKLVCTSAPKELAEIYVDRAFWLLPQLSMVFDIPTMRPDGSIISRPGHDDETCIHTDFNVSDFHKIESIANGSPTFDDAKAAIEKLLRLIQTWPFVSSSDRSVAVAAILSVVARPAFDSAPLFGISATTRGTGKSLLVDVIATIATGRRVAVFSQSASDEEFEKRLSSILLAGNTIANIDNVERPLGGDYLCQVMTQPITQVRVLGRSKMVEVPSAILFSTGNNLVAKGDMGRRTLLCSLNAGVERPEEREFAGDILAETMEQRAELVIAALTVLRGFVVAGKPKQTTALGSFEQWSRLVRDALIWVGEADPVETMKKVQDDDPERSAIAAVMNSWWDSKALVRNQYYTAAGIIEAAKDDADLSRALWPVANIRNDLNPIRFGKWLGSIKGRVVDGKMIEGSKNRMGTMEWRVVSVDQADNTTSA